MGTKWLIEDRTRDIPTWYSGTKWTTDCHEALQFDGPDKANNYILHKQFAKGVIATEHIFMSPISTEQTLN